MAFLYNLGIHIHLWLIRLASLFHPKAKKWIIGRRDTFIDLKHFSGTGAPVVWFHCASLGEFEQGRPVIEAFKAKYPGYKILLTFYSPSGFEVRRNYLQADLVCYLPADTSQNARKFVSIVKPVFAVFVKYEYWHNYLNELAGKNIPLIVISAIFRPDQYFFRWWGGWFLNNLKKVRYFFVQDMHSLRILQRHGITQACLSGDTRFDRVLQIASEQASIDTVEDFCEGKQAIVAGSTWPADEQVLARLFFDLDEKPILIIAPHEVNETHLQQLDDVFKGNAIRYSQLAGKADRTKSVLIIDNIGMLSKLYRYGSLAYVGGGFGAGIHNLLEAAVYGIPVLFGPNNHKFKEAQGLIAVGGGFSISNYGDLKLTFQKLISGGSLKKSGASAEDYIRKNAGATIKIMRFIDSMMPLTTPGD